MEETNWIDIGKAGTFTANNGSVVTLTEEDFDRIIQNYNPAKLEAPLDFWHSSTDHPAWGWVTRLQRAGDTLQARFKQVSDPVKELVKNGNYKKISMALMPDKTTIRHIGLLGAAQPAIPGMRNVDFSSGDSIYFTEESFFSVQEAADAFHGRLKPELSSPTGSYVDLTRHI